MTTSPDPPRTGPYEVFILVLSLFALAALVAQRVLALSPEQALLLEWFDLGVCAVFFADFVYTLARAPDRWRYLRTWGWLDLVSSIPASGAFRWARSPRIVRIVRLLRSLRVARMLARSVVARRAESSLMTAGLVALAVLVLASVAILQVEQDASSNIRSAEDALWWAVSTMTTVGYGDVYPVTPEGRLVGAGLMVVGVGLLGVFTAFLASRFVKSEEAELGRRLDSQLGEVRREIAELREIVEKGLGGRG